MMTALEAARDALAALDGVQTCKIGLESGISPADWPLVRLVPDRISPGRPYDKRTATTTIHFGVDIGQCEDGLEAVYAQLFTLEALIIAELKTLGGRYLETITDSDELPTYKMMAIRCELQG